MALLTYILLLGVMDLVVGRECGSYVLQNLMVENQLKNDLFQYCYGRFPPPKVPHSEKTTVTVRFIMKYFSINDKENTFHLQPWTFMSWTDNRLKWDPANYRDLEEIEVSSNRLWVPNLSITNTTSTEEEISQYYNFPCTLKHTGEVVCALRTSHVFYCHIKLSDFPYDAQRCSFEFGNSHQNDGYNVTFGSRAMSMLGADYGSSWFISDYKQNIQQFPTIRLNITLVMEREAQSLAAVIVYPALIISSLTVACLFLDTRLNERILFTCFSIFSHSYWLRELVANLPKLSEDPPRILLYYRGSFFITVFILLLTFILTMLCRIESTPHNIVTFINKVVYGGYVKFLVFPRWESTNDSKFNEDWTKLANIVNSLCIIVIVSSYIGLYIAFIPQPIPFN